MVSIETHRPNCTTVTVQGLDLYFSYKTCIGFRILGKPPVFCENDWGPTTSRHLALFGSADKQDRLSRPDFLIELTRVTQCLN